jgi:hypothetical protein
VENKVQNHFISGETLIGVPCLENDTLFGSLVQDLIEQQFVTSGRCGLLQGSTFWHTIQQIVESDIYGLLQGNNFWYIIQQFVKRSYHCPYLLLHNISTSFCNKPVITSPLLSIQVEQYHKTDIFHI